MFKIKLLTSSFYLIIIGYYGSSFGLLPRAMGIWIGFISGSFPATINSVLQVILITYLILTALVKPYYKNEKTLFILTFIVLGFNALTNILSLSKTPKEVITYSIITTLLFYICLYFYGYRAFKQDKKT